MKSILKLMLLILVVVIALMFAFVYFMRPPQEYKTFTGPGFSLEVPMEAIAKQTENDEWEGYDFTGYGNPSIFYYSPLY